MGTSPVTVRFRLKELLEELDAAGQPLNQSELARQSGVSLSIVNAIAQNRQKQVSLATLDALCAVLDVEPGELLEREPAATRGRPRTKPARG